jgi:methylmalonyl-CoA mutase N-terminal domain/subunit
MATTAPPAEQYRADSAKPLSDAQRGWQEALAATPDRSALFTTMSGDEVPRLSTPDSAQIDYDRRLGYPGQFPYTRGVYPSMYRGRLWTMRQFAGFGTAAETNERFHYLLEHGQHGLSVAFDMPTLMGYDSDSPMSLGEVGREGVAVDTLDDMLTLFKGVNVGEVSTSMTVNGPAPILLAQYVCVAEQQGVSMDKLSGTIQTDILKEYIAQKEWIFPPDPSMDLVTDMIEYCSRNLPRWHPVSISGYHIREAGSTAAQELAFTLADGFAYVEACIARGLDVDSFAPRLSFFFNCHIDFFEEVAKLRAARRIWATVMRDKYGAKDPKSLLCRFHCQTAGVSLTAQQPLVNIARTAVEAMAAVMGGAQSLHTNSYDEALALPTEEAVQVALRTQQVLAEETGIVNSIDPLGGSYYVEEMTDRIERQAYEYFERIDQLGGTVEAVKQNFRMREIAEASFRYQQEVESGQRRIVGVNAHTVENEEEIPLLHIDTKLETQQVERLRKIREERDGVAVSHALERLQVAARKGGENLMPLLVDASRVYASEGEIVASLKEVYGTWRETPVF